MSVIELIAECIAEALLGRPKGKLSSWRKAISWTIRIILLVALLIAFWWWTMFQKRHT